MMKDKEIDALYYEISILLDGVLYYSGVKRDKLEKASEIYVEIIDDVLNNSDKSGVDEIIEVINYMKENYKELFE